MDFCWLYRYTRADNKSTSENGSEKNPKVEVVNGFSIFSANNEEKMARTTNKNASPIRLFVAIACLCIFAIQRDIYFKQLYPMGVDQSLQPEDLLYIFGERNIIVHSDNLIKTFENCAKQA